MSRRLVIMFVLLVALCTAVLLAFVVRISRSSARARLVAATMDTVFMAIFNYESVYGHIPAAVICDSGGRPLYSWRFAIVPFLESDIHDMNLEVTWDNPANVKWRRIAVGAYCLSEQSKETLCSNIAAVTGVGAAFDDSFERRLSDLPDATILLVAVAGPNAHWMEPGGDISVHNIPSTLGQGIYGTGVHVAFADGLVWQLRSDVPVERLTKFLTTDGARDYDRDAVLRPYLVDEYEGFLRRSH